MEGPLCVWDQASWCQDPMGSHRDPIGARDPMGGPPRGPPMGSQAPGGAPLGGPPQGPGPNTYTARVPYGTLPHLSQTRPTYRHVLGPLKPKFG